MVAAWYAGNTLYNIYNKKATNMIHAHWFVAAAQLVVGVVWSMVMWGTGMRKTPNLTAADIAACIPIGLFACMAHAGSVLAVSAYDVSNQRLYYPLSTTDNNVSIYLYVKKLSLGDV